MGGILPAALYLSKARKDPAERAEGRFPPFTFIFRGTDLTAVREQLVNLEYGFLGPVLRDSSSPLIIDAGAHIGLFSLWALSVNPASRILSVEADPLTYAVLCENIARASTIVGSWRAINRAAWEDRKRVRFSDSGESMGHRVSETGTISVEGVTLDDLIKMVAFNGEIDLLKVDVEGAEEPFLCANPSTLASVRNLVVELHPKLCDASQVESLLRSSFVSVENIEDKSSSKPLLLCRR